MILFTNIKATSKTNCAITELGDHRMNKKFKREYLKFTGKIYKGTIYDLLRIKFSHTLSFLYYGRCIEAAKSRIAKKYYKIRCKHIGTLYGNEIPSFDKIGEGLMLCHGYGITVNANAIIGRDVTLFKGCTVGGVRSGKKAGAPVIGDRVVLCCNSTVVGNITIGNDVMIAPGAYVNFDVPDNSVVIGNPGVIHHKEHAADDYFTAFSVKSECGLKM